jgi:hypothetical protein
MKLETAERLWFAAVTEEQLGEAFRDDAGRGECIILSQQPDVFIQASGEDDGPYVMEYRDQDDDHHFRADTDLSKADVLRAFLWYLARDERWRTDFPWQKAAPRPWWKFW